MKSAKYSAGMAKHSVEPRVMLSCRIKPHLVAALDDLVPVMNIRRSELVEQAIEEFIERHAPKAKGRKAGN